MAISSDKLDQLSERLKVTRSSRSAGTAGTKTSGTSRLDSLSQRLSEIRLSRKPKAQKEPLSVRVDRANEETKKAVQVYEDTQTKGFTGLLNRVNNALGFGVPAPTLSNASPEYNAAATGQAAYQEALREAYTVPALKDAAGKMLRALPGKALDSPKAAFEFSKEFGKDVLRFIPRLTAQAGLSLAEGAGVKSASQYQPETSVEKFIYGDEPILSVQRKTENAIKTGEQLGLSKGQSVATATPLVVGSVLLDYLPGGSAEKKAVSRLAKETDETVIGKILKDLKVPADDIPRLSEQLKFAKTPEQVKTILKQPSSLGTPEGKAGLEKVKKILAPKEEEKRTVSQRISDSIGAVTSKFRTQLTSRFTPVGDIEKKVAKESGETFTFKDSAQQVAENFTSRRAAAGAAVKEYEAKVIEPIKNMYEEFNQFLFLKRTESRLASGEARQAVGDFTETEVKQNLQELRAQVGAEAFGKLQRAGEELQRFADDNLTELRDSGVISAEAYKAIKESNDFYAPFKVLKYVSEVDNGFIPGTGKSLNLSRQEVVKAMTGIKDSDFNLGDIAAEMAGKIYSARVTAAKNRFMQRFSGIAKMKGAEKLGIKFIRKAEDVKKRIDIWKEVKILRKEQNKLERLLKTRGRWARRLVSELNQLNKQGIKAYLKRKDTAPERGRMLDAIAKEGSRITDEIGVRETKKIINELVQLEPEKLSMIKKKIANREPKLAQVIDEIEELRGVVDDVRTEKADLIDEARALRDAKKEGGELVSYYVDGVKETIQVPSEVAASIKALDVQQLGAIMKGLKYAQAPFRAGVTTFNVGFQLVNFIFDTLRTATISKFRIKNPIDAVKFSFDLVSSFFEALGGNMNRRLMSKMYKEARENGAFSGTIYNSFINDYKKINPSEITNYKELKKLNKLNIIDAFGKIGNAIEETNKLLGYKRGMQRLDAGKMSQEEMLYEIRNFAGSPDFSRGGNLTPDMNVLFSFFNARIQGLAADMKRLSGYSDGGKEAGKAWLTIATLIGAPILKNTVRNNTEFKEDYEKLTDWEKKNYIIIYQDDYVTDANGEYVLDDAGNKIRDAIRIPVRDTLGAVKNLVETSVDFSFQDDKSFTEKAKEYAEDTFEAFSPIPIADDNASSQKPAVVERLESAASALNPALKAPLEYVTGRDFFRKRDTIPEYIEGVKSDELPPELRAKLDTPNFYKELGKATGQSPLQLEQLANTFGANIFSQFWGKSDQRGNAVTRRFMKSPYVRLDQEEITQLENANQEEAMATFENNTKARVLWDALKPLSKTERQEKLEAMKESGELDEKLYKRYTKLKQRDELGFTTRDFELQDLGVKNGARAKALITILKDKTPEERKSILVDLQKKKILTEEVYRQYQYLKSK